MGTSLTFPPGTSLASLRDAVWGLRLYRLSFGARLAVAMIGPLLFPWLVVVTTLAAKRPLGGDAFDRVPVVVVARASGTTTGTMIVALARVLTLARSCRATAVLATAVFSLSVGFLADVATLSVPLVESRPLTDRILLDYLPAATLLSGGASLTLVTGVLGRIAREIDAAHVAVRARAVQTLAIGAVVLVLGALVAWAGSSAKVATVFLFGSVGAGVAAVVLHWMLVGQATAALVERLERQGVATAAAGPEESGPRRGPRAVSLAAGLTALATFAFAMSTVVVRRWEQQRGDLPFIRALDTQAAVVAARCGDPRAKLPIAPLEASHQTEDSTSDSMLTLTAKGDVFRRSRLVARLSGACVLDLRGGVLVSVDARGLLRGPRHEPLGEFRSGETWDVSGVAVTVGDILVGPDGAATGIANDGAVYFVGPPPYDGGREGSGDEASSVPAAVKGEVSRARRTALLLDSLIGRLAPADP